MPDAVHKYGCIPPLYTGHVDSNVDLSSLALWREKVHFVISDHNKMEVDPALFDEHDDLEMLEAEAFRDQLPQHRRLRREKVYRQRINMDFPVVEEFR